MLSCHFLGSKAVDTLYESKKYGHDAKDAKFANRLAAVTFLKILLEKGLFFRARKLVAKKKTGNGEVCCCICSKYMFSNFKSRYI